MQIHLNSDVKVTWIWHGAISFSRRPPSWGWYLIQPSRGLGLVLIKRRAMNGSSCKRCQKSICNLRLYLGAILDESDARGAAVWLQSVTPPASLSLTTNKLRFLLFHVNANVYDCQRGEAKGCLEVNQAFPSLQQSRSDKCILNGFQLWIYYRGFLSHFQHQIPHYHFRKKAACTYFSYSLLILTHNDVLRCGIMKLVEQKKKKQTKKQTKKMPQKLNVVLSCAYLSKVVLWGNICRQGLCSPCLGPPIQQHLLGKNRLKVTHS